MLNVIRKFRAGSQQSQVYVLNINRLNNYNKKLHKHFIYKYKILRNQDYFLAVTLPRLSNYQIYMRYQRDHLIEMLMNHTVFIIVVFLVL